MTEKDRSVLYASIANFEAVAAVLLWHGHHPALAVWMAFATMSTLVTRPSRKDDGP